MRLAPGAPRLLAAIACASGLVVCANASAAAYRCTVDGRTTYSDRPCTTGSQSQVAIDTPAPSAADRAAAEERLRVDQRTAAELQRERLAREQVQPASTRANAERARQARNCAKLTLRARRAREDYERAGPRDQWQKQIRLRRADEDRVAACSTR